MGEVSDIVKLYVDDSDMLEDAAKVISSDLRENMQSNLWAPNHGYDQGELHDDIYSLYTVENPELAIVVGGFTVEHGKYVISGVRGRGMAKSGPIDFLTLGLEKTIEMYR